MNAIYGFKCGVLMALRNVFGVMASRKESDRLNGLINDRLKNVDMKNKTELICKKTTSTSSIKPRDFR